MAFGQTINNENTNANAAANANTILMSMPTMPNGANEESLKAALSGHEKHLNNFHCQLEHPSWVYAAYDTLRRCNVISKLRNIIRNIEIYIVLTIIT